MRPVFGQPPPKHVNPCVMMYGIDSARRKCAACAHLLMIDYHNKTYYKCDLRRLTHGAGSDHRKYWEACAKFQEEEKEQDAIH